MKLKCTYHHRRVVIIQGRTSKDTNYFVHRTGDGSRCDSELANMGDKLIDPNRFEETRDRPVYYP